IFENSGNLKIYNGNYADYKIEQEQILRDKKEKVKSIPAEKIISSSKTEKKRLSYKEQLEYESLEKEITEIENIIIQKTELLNTITSHQEITEIALDIEKLQNELDNKSERWLELAECI